MTTANPATPPPDLRIGSLFSGARAAFRSRPGLMLSISLAGIFAPNALVAGALHLLELYVLAPGNINIQKSALQGVAQPIAVLFLVGTFPVALRVWLGEEARFSMVFRAFSGQRFRSLIKLFLTFCLPWLAVILLVGLVLLAALTLQPEAKSLGAYLLGGLVVFFGCAWMGAQIWLLAVFGPAWLMVQEADMTLSPALRLARELTRGYRGKLAWLLVIATALFFFLAPLGMLTIVASLQLFSSMPVLSSMMLALATLPLLALPLVQLMLAGAYEELVQSYAAQVQAPDEAQPAEA